MLQKTTKMNMKLNKALLFFLDIYGETGEYLTDLLLVHLKKLD